MSEHSKMRSNVAKIAGLTLPSRELDCRAFDLIDIQGYMELADDRQMPSIVADQRANSPLSVDCLGTLAEPSSVLQFNLEVS